MDKLVLIFAGGGVGAVARYLLGIGAGRAFGHAWPWGTFLVNVTGGLAMGLLISTLAHRGGADQERWRLMIGVGLLGGFTTFSAFSMETALMIERRAVAQAFTYSALSVIVSVTALFAGMLIARRLFA